VAMRRIAARADGPARSKSMRITSGRRRAPRGSALDGRRFAHDAQLGLAQATAQAGA
jgi:hypothetical protein